MQKATPTSPHQADSDTSSGVKSLSYAQLAGTTSPGTPVPPPVAPHARRDSTEARSKSATFPPIDSGSQAGASSAMAQDARAFFELALQAPAAPPTRGYVKVENHRSLFDLALAEAEADCAAAAPVTNANTPTLRFGGAPHPIEISTEHAGDWIGPYQLRELLGEGGFGMVWLAQQKEPLPRQVALKLIKPGMDSQEIIGRFESERKALALMDHPNIARVLDAGVTSQRRPYFVMELVDGSPITQYCDLHRLSVRQRLELFLQVCRGVHHAHQKAIIHRDLKPSNILVVEREGAALPKVIDFGIAKALGKTAPLGQQLARTLDGMALGTPQYMSPEQASATPFPDTRSDVYSLGVLLHELLVGATPIPRAKVQSLPMDEVLRLVREKEPSPPSALLKRSTPELELDQVCERRATDLEKLRRALRGDLDWITCKALDKLPAQRYGSAADLARDVERHLHDQTVEAGAPSRLLRFQKLLRRHRVAFTAAASVTFALVAGAGISTWLAIRASRAETHALSLLSQVAAEKGRANQQAEIATAVNDFLRNDILAQAGPTFQSHGHVRPKPDLTVREALERSAETVATRFGDTPIVEAEIRATLGRAYLDLDLPAQAVPQLKRSLQLRRQLLGPDDALTLTTRCFYALALHHAGRYVEAEAEQLATYHLREHLFGPESPEALEARMDRANDLERLGRLAEAESELRAIVNIRNRRLGPEHIDTLKARVGIGGALQDEGHAQEAADEFSAILAIATRNFGPYDPFTLETQRDLAATYNALGNLQRAEPMYRDLIKRSVETMGAEHPFTLMAQEFLANCLIEKGDRDNAIAIYRQVLADRTRVLGAQHVRTLHGQCNLGHALYRQGSYSESEALLRSALEGCIQAVGKSNDLTLLATQFLSCTLRAETKFQDAEKIDRDILAATAPCLKIAPAYIDCQLELARALGREHREAEALTYAKAAEDQAAQSLSTKNSKYHTAVTLYKSLELDLARQRGELVDLSPF